MIRGMGHISSKERPGELSLFILEKRRLPGGLIKAFQFVKEAYEKDRTNILARPVAIGEGEWF